MAIMLFIFFLFLRPPTATARNQLVKLSTDDSFRRAAGYGEEKLSTVVVGGSLLCDACLDGIETSSGLQSNPIAGASMAVSCETGKKTTTSNWIQGRTDEYGEFLIDLPSNLHAVPHMENRCTVRILGLPNTSPCHQAVISQHTSLKLSSVKNGIRKYTAHHIHLKPKYFQSQAHALKNKAASKPLFTHSTKRLQH